MAPRLKAQRQLRWNFESSSNPENHHIMILLINTSQEMDVITQRVYERFQPIIDEQVRARGRVGDLNYRLLTFDSNRQPTSEDFTAVYGGRVRRDAKSLYERDNPRGLPDFIVRNIRKIA